jgi:hypothetical protein
MNEQGTVTPLRREPIRQSTLVRSDAAHTFEVFVGSIGSWWPLRPLSLGEERVIAVTFEQRLGGRVYETWDDARQASWGRVVVWDPPARFVLSWEVLPVTTEVELTFLPLGPALTRVELEHRGWERMSEEQVSELRGSFTEGWIRVLSDFSDFTAASGA